MASAAIASLSERCCEWLSTEMVQWLHGYNVDDKVRSLQEKINWLCAYLKDVDDRSVDNERAKLWVSTIRDIAYDAEDIVDDFIDMARHNKRVRYLALFWNPLPDAAKKIDATISRLNETIANQSAFGIESFVATTSRRGEKIPPVVEELDVIGLDDDASMLAKELTQGAKRLSLVSIVGMGGVGKTTLARRLYNSRDIMKQFDHHAWVYVSQDYNVREILQGIIRSIVSQKKKDVELIEKMTESELRKITKSELRLEFREHLEENRDQVVLEENGDQVVPDVVLRREDRINMWNNMSLVEQRQWQQELSEGHGTLMALREMSRTQAWFELLDKMSVGELQQKLYELLEGKTYLVVFDDVWQKEAWDILAAALPRRHFRSRILLTTRNKDVALHAFPQGFLHEMGSLSESDSWKLFCSKAFVRDNTCTCPANLENDGRKIVAKCGGLPLAIIMLGGLLSTKGNHPFEWAKVLKRVHWHLHEGESQIAGILALSYYDLPYHLKSCFHYIGAFPEDSEIRSSTLIKLWAAEGFIPQRGDETIEDAAEDCLNELVSRSMVQMAKTNSYGAVKTCRVHDLLRDLSISKSKEAKFLERYVNVEPISPTKARRLAVAHQDLRDGISHNRAARHLRSLLQFPTDAMSPTQAQQYHIIHGYFRFLRVLNLDTVNIYSKHIDEIASLVHLRYLGLRNTCLEDLPYPMSNLYNLQTLDIRNTNIIILPEEVWKLKRLRHLRTENIQLDEPAGAATSHFIEPEDLRRGTVISHAEIDNFFNLQTLTGVRAGNWMEDGLEKFSSLTKLSMWGDFSPYNNVFSKVKFACLKSLKLITNIDGSIPTLSCFSHNHHLYSMHLRGRMETQSHPHQAPPNLIKLTLIVSCLNQEPLATLEKLQNLRTLTLCKRSYIANEMVFSARGFPSLQVLRLHDLEELNVWIVVEGAMPALRHLEICNCRNLNSLPGGLRHLTNLQEFTIIAPSHLLKPRLKKDAGDEWYKIQHVPSITIR